jgi:hypothetical protein
MMAKEKVGMGSCLGAAFSSFRIRALRFALPTLHGRTLGKQSIGSQAAFQIRSVLFRTCPMHGFSMKLQLARGLRFV